MAVIVSDTFGRPWREGGRTNVAIGVAGMDPMADYVGREDCYGQVMRTTVIAVADELAAAAELVTGGRWDGVPAVVIKGYGTGGAGPGEGERRPGAHQAPERDMFR